MSVILFCFFFFKQKTAYEMRISDWSSDVCSSDLSVVRAPRLRCRLRNHRAGHGRPVRALGLSLCAQGGRAAGLSQLDGHPKSQWGDGLLHAQCLEPDAPERKSVVKGKSGSVPVTNGGRRII